MPLVQTIATMPTISGQARQELVKAIRERTWRFPVVRQARILDEFIALTGYHRKHAIRLLRATTSEPVHRPPIRRLPVYDEAVREALVVLWEASDRICGKRLKALLPVLLPALEKHRHMSLDETVRERLLTVSAATIDRLLASRREALPHRRRKTRSRVSGQIPVRTFADWQRADPGFVESRPRRPLRRERGRQLRRTRSSLTDIASGWTECVALLVREGALVVDAIDRLRDRDAVPACEASTRTTAANSSTRSCSPTARRTTSSSRGRRPHRKNDQAWVEQKNGAVVRRLVGYGRLEGIRPARSARPAVHGIAAVRELLPAVVQARREDAGRRPCPQAIPRARDAVCATAGVHMIDDMKERLRAVLSHSTRSGSSMRFERSSTTSPASPPANASMCSHIEMPISIAS